MYIYLVYICISNYNKQFKTNVMKTLLITISIIAFSLVSCSKSEISQPTKFKFYHGDTNVQIKDAKVMMEAMKQNKLYRLDVTTGECYNYTTNTK